MKHKKCFGFLLIEVMMTLTVLGVLGGVSLYFGGIIMQKVRSFQETAEGLRIATVIASYHDETGFFPAMRTDCWEDIHDNSEAFIDAVTDVLDDGCFTSEERCSKKLNVRIWVLGKQRISCSKACEALSRMLHRTIAPSEVHAFNNEVLWFLPKKDDEFAGYSCGF
ncbi:MAG: type II secretion system protein [Opitutales bacterium]|nr:type II secretion system protein [Opitutales bacterium]